MGSGFRALSRKGGLALGVPTTGSNDYVEHMPRTCGMYSSIYGVWEGT